MIVIAKKVGRLANRLILFAHFIATAAEHGFTVVNPAFHTYARYFPSTAGDLLCRFPAGRRVPRLPGSSRFFYEATVLAADGLHRLQAAGRDVGLIRLRRDQQLDLNGETFLDIARSRRLVLVQDWYFRSPENCERHRDVVRAFFTPSCRHLDGARAAVGPARARGGLVVGVHIRRTDYAKFKGGSYFYSLEQYRRVMEAVQAAFATEDVSFFVCSDEDVPSDVFAGLEVSRGNGHQVEDLYALSLCDRLVGPPSTYTAWASWYGDVPRYQIFDPDERPAPSSFEVDPGLSRAPAATTPWQRPL